MQLYTPQSILKCVVHDDDSPVDCFEDAVPADNPYRDDLVNQLWVRYRYSMINSVCLDRWLQRLTDRASEIDRRYTVLIGEWESTKDKIASFSIESSESHEDETTQSSTGSDRTVATSEDIPATSGASASSWLSGRNITESTPGVTATIKTAGRSEAKSNADINAEQWAKVLRDLKDPYAEYAKEFSDLFVDYYDLNGGCCGCLRRP